MRVIKLIILLWLPLQTMATNRFNIPEIQGTVIIDYIYANGFEHIPQRNDTGNTHFFVQGSSSRIPCDQSTKPPQDCDTGRDQRYHGINTDGYAGFSFTRLDANGDEIIGVEPWDPDWKCTKDNVTGLYWERKTNDGGEQDAANKYKWGGITHIGSNFGDPSSYYNDWDDLVNTVNNNNHCGFSDWRVPTRFELLDLLDYGSARTYGTFYQMPTMFYFYSSVGFRFWTASPSAMTSGGVDAAWYVDFKTGKFDQTSRVAQYAVMLVRKDGE